jgi:hypothetical protein
MGAYSNDNILISANKDDLLAKLKTNREKHITEHKSALAGWEQKVREARKELAGWLSDDFDEIDLDDERTDINEYQVLVASKPSSHEDDYNVVIEMLEWHDEPTFKIERGQFRKYVQDKWDWKHSHNQALGMYTVQGLSR